MDYCGKCATSGAVENNGLVNMNSQNQSKFFHIKNLRFTTRVCTTIFGFEILKIDIYKFGAKKFYARMAFKEILC